MDENSQRLRATITELERELRGGHPVDAETRAMLLEAVEEIQAALHASTAPATSEPHTLGERLNQAAAGFDASHPTLAGLLRRVVDALSQLGI
jgi:hypothetical protein